MSPRNSRTKCQIISDHIEPPGKSRGTLPKTPPAYPNSVLPAPGGRKNASHCGINRLGETVECRGAFRRHGGRWHWGRGRHRCRQRHTFHQPRRSIPLCVPRGLWAPLPLGLAGSSDWPGESGRDVWSYTRKSMTRNVSPKSNHDSHSTEIELATWPNLPKFSFFHLPHLPFVIKMGRDALIKTWNNQAKSNGNKKSKGYLHHNSMSAHVTAVLKALMVSWMLNPFLLILAGGNAMSNSHFDPYQNMLLSACNSMGKKTVKNTSFYLKLFFFNYLCAKIAFGRDIYEYMLDYVSSQKDGRNSKCVGRVNVIAGLFLRKGKQKKTVWRRNALFWACFFNLANVLHVFFA